MKKSLLERLLGSASSKKESNKQEIEATVSKQLKSLVYDDELVKELTPVFLKLQGAEGFSKIVELLEAKERQIEVISGGEWFKQETNPEDNAIEEDEDEQENLVDAYLNKKYTKE